MNYLMPKSSKEAVVRLNARVALIIAPKVRTTPPVAAIQAYLGWTK